VQAFGFEEIYRLAMPDGQIGHAELKLGDSTINVASVYESMGFASPLDLPGCAMQLACWVPDVDAHYAQAVAGGATVAGEPEDQPYGARMYRAVDPGGHRWTFATYTKLMSPDEISAAYGM